MKQTLELPFVSHKKITEELLALVNALAESFASESQRTAEKNIFEKFGITPKTQQRYKTELRRMYELPARAPISAIANHWQLRQAIEVILTHDERSDKLSLRSAKNLCVIVEKTGEVISLEEHLKACYPYETTSQKDVYQTLIGLHKMQRIMNEHGERISYEDLPSEVSVCRFLRKWKKHFVSVRRGKTRENDWVKKEQTYITRNAEQYRPGEVWITDHTELDFMVMNENGKPDRRWITAFIDMRTRLIVGYHLSWQPSSTTIALAYRNGVLSTQLKAAANSGSEITYRDVHIITVPECVMMDNGKDYRSKYTKAAFGKVDFTDDARKSVQRISRLHYVKTYHGQSKAPMERWFGVIQGMMKHLHGYKGNVYQNKPDSLKEDLKTGNILHVEEFDRMVGYMINVYNNRIHSSLKEQSPMQYYLSNADLNRTIDVRVLDFLLQRVQRNNGKPPKIERGQVIANGKEYCSEQLVQFNGEFADVYYDPNDPGYVSVYVRGEFAAIAVNKTAAQTDDGWRKQLVAQSHSEKQMLQELKKFREPYAKDDVKEMILIGRMTNVSPVSEELLQKEIPTMTVYTGIEETAKERHDALENKKQVVGIELEAKKKFKNKRLTASMIDKL